MAQPTGSRGPTFWVEKMEESIAMGNFNEFTSILRDLCVICSRNSDAFAVLNQKELMRKVMPKMLNQLYNGDVSVVFNKLASKPCNDTGFGPEDNFVKFATPHPYCRMIFLIADNVDPLFLHAMMYPQQSRNKQSRESGVHPPCLHHAIQEGTMCVINAFLELGANPNRRDKEGCTAMHYALLKNNIEICNVLSWYGGDFNLTCNNPKAPKMVTNDAVVWVKKRQDKMLKHFKEFVDNATNCELKLYNVKPLSQLYQFRLSNDVTCPILNNGILTYTIEFDLNFDYKENYPVIIIIPFAYEPQTPDSASDHLPLRRLDLFDANERPARFMISRPILSNKSCSAPLAPAFVKEDQLDHNGYFYAFEVPDKLTNEYLNKNNVTLAPPFSLAFNLDLSYLTSDQQKRYRFMIQAYDVNSSTHIRNKKKND